MVPPVPPPPLPLPPFCLPSLTPLAPPPSSLLGSQKRGSDEFEAQGRAAKRKKASEPQDIYYMPDASTLSFAVAHKKLNSIFGQFMPKKIGSSTFQFTPREEFPFEHVMFLLRAHPALIELEFHENGVLSLLLHVWAGPKFVREWCQLYKAHTTSASLSLQRYHFDELPNPINEYCLYGGAEGVLRILLEEFPGFLQKPDESNQYPFRTLLDVVDDSEDEFPRTPVAVMDPSGHLVHTLKTMLEFDPGLLASCDQYYTPQYFLNTDYLSMEARQFLYEKYAQRFGIETFDNRMMELDWSDGGNEDISDLNPVPVNLPLLKHLHFEVEDFGVQASNLFLEALFNVSEPAFVNLEIPLREDCLGGITGKRLRETLNKSKCLKHLHLTRVGRDPSEGSLHPVIDLCADVIKNNQGIESLTLSWVSTTSTGLCKLLSNCQSLKSLTLVNPTISSNELPSYVSTTSCSLEKIDIELCDPEELLWLKGFFGEMRNFPLLTKLGITCDGMTEEVGNLISEQLPNILEMNRLRSFHTNCNLTMEALSQALTSNSSLKELSGPISEDSMEALADILEQDNMTLQKTATFFQRNALSAFPMASHPKGRKVLYFVMLNRFGRAKLRNRGATLTDMVESLSGVENTSGEDHEKALKHSVQYGLLHQAPSLWT